MITTTTTTTCSSHELRLGPLHTQAKSRDYEIVRAQMKVSKGRPNTTPKSCRVVTDPQPNAISMNFYSCMSSHMTK